MAKLYEYTLWLAGVAFLEGTLNHQSNCITIFTRNYYVIRIEPVNKEWLHKPKWSYIRYDTRTAKRASSSTDQFSYVLTAWRTTLVSD